MNVEPSYNPKVLILNPGYTQHCGVYAHGKRMYQILRDHPEETGAEVFYFEFDSYEGMEHILNADEWDVVFYNHYEGNMPWIEDLNPLTFGGVHLGLIHEVTQATVEQPPNPLFNGWVISDPSIDLEGRPEGWFKTVRPLPHVGTYWSESQIPHYKESRLRIGTFGFAFPGKGFVQLAREVNQNFTVAILRMHITQSPYGQELQGGNPEEIRALVQAELTNPNIELQFTTDYKSDKDLVEWLAYNDLNCLLYDPNPCRGISSAADYCIASGAPLLLSHSEQFRHLPGHMCHPEISVGHALMMDGLLGTESLQQLWGPKVFRSDYRKIIEKVCT